MQRAGTRTLPPPLHRRRCRDCGRRAGVQWRSGAVVVHTAWLVGSYSIVLANEANAGQPSLPLLHHTLQCAPQSDSTGRKHRTPATPRTLSNFTRYIPFVFYRLYTTTTFNLTQYSISIPTLPIAFRGASTARDLQAQPGALRLFGGG